MPETADRPDAAAVKRARTRHAWLKAALLLGGCFLAGWLGGRAGRYFQFAADDFRPAPPPHMYVSGRTYLEADVPLAPARDRGT